jgi:hypothetical protein
VAGGRTGWGESRELRRVAVLVGQPRGRVAPEPTCILRLNFRW